MTPAEFRAAFVRGLLAPLDPRTLLDPHHTGGTVNSQALRESRLDNDRRNRLLCVIRAEGGEWTAGRAWELYRERGWASCRTTARKDLQFLARRGHLVESGPENGRLYTLKYAGGAR
ncbi:hypothetical protein [Streptomyces sp. NPDC051173]|uniref:hypothetical protein n=1 Tax=Streptomyces sp. NPDC051173 TaxID=3155164 RepID=UPI00344B0A13